MIKISDLLWIFIFLLITTEVSAKNSLCLKINGLSSVLEKGVRSQLSNIEMNQIKTDRSFFLRIESTIRKTLKALGYYEPIINFDLHSSQTKACQILFIHINVGKPIRIYNINIALNGEARNDHDYLDLLKKCPSIGTILKHSDYDKFKESLTSISLQKGYFDSQFVESQLGILLTKHQAFWNINYNSGKRYRFGPITFEGSQIRNEYLKNLVPFKEGDYFESKALAELNYRLSATGWFNSITILPEFNKSYKTKILKLHGNMSPRIKNFIETGISYSNDVGSQIRIFWEQPWINSYGHSVNVSTKISSLEKELNFSYKIPLKKNPLEQYFLIQNKFNYANLHNNIKEKFSKFFISRHWSLSNGWQRSINLYWDINHFTQSKNTNSSMLIYSGVVISRIRSNENLMPTKGDSQRYSVDYSSTRLGSHANFLIVQAKNIWIRTPYHHHRVVIRNDFGWIKTNNFNGMLPELRFFSGGDRSIRGYRYKSISPKDNMGQLIGASKLFINSLEYQYNIFDKWWFALFVDSGEAVNNIHFSDLNTGLGIGIRREFLIGPIKFDFAIPVGEKRPHNLQFYVSIGPEL